MATQSKGKKKVSNYWPGVFLGDGNCARELDGSKGNVEGPPYFVLIELAMRNKLDDEVAQQRREATGHHPRRAHGIQCYHLVLSTEVATADKLLGQRIIFYQQVECREEKRGAPAL